MPNAHRPDGDDRAPDRERADDLVARDRRVAWHPYSPPEAPTLFAVDRAEGAELHLTDGRVLIDGMSSWWSAIHGYRHPHIEAAVKAQLEKLPHVMFGGLTHAPAVELCERLVRLSPEGLDRVFLVDSGSISVEVAQKVAFQYWMARGEPQRRRLLTVGGGYHGDTFATMALCDPRNGMHGVFGEHLAKHVFAERPACRFDEPFEERHIADLEAKLRAHAHELAAVILEPVVQAAGGMWFYAPGYLTRLRELCDELDVLLIFDEIATGFGRTGKLFAAEHAGIAPDIMTVGKSLTGGTMTLAATLISGAIAEAIGESEVGVLMHGPTFMANPLACSAALASLDLLETTPWQANVARIESALRDGLAPARDIPGVRDVRVLGAIGAVELEEPVDMRTIQPAFVERGIWIRPFGRTVYTMPPFVTTDAQVEALATGLVAVLREQRVDPATPRSSGQ